MSVLIKDMEMPETCEHCPFHVYHSRGEYVCRATVMLYPMNLANSKGIRKDWCPLSEVPEPCEDKLKKIADALSEKMCYMNTCPNERDIILSYLGRKRSNKNHCNTDCWNEKCESYNCETKRQPEPSQVARDIANIIENEKDMRVIARSEITDEQAILHLQASGWMQRHDKEMYKSGLRAQLADDNDSDDALLESAQPDVPDTNVGDTISRQAALDIINAELNGWLTDDERLHLERVGTAIELLPSAQKRGKWIRTGLSDEGYTVHYRCSCCRQEKKWNWDYCPSCGARMDSE